MNQQVIEALRLAVESIEYAARMSGPMGAPSGHVYAALMQHGMTLAAYQSIIAALVEMGRITVEHDCIKLVER